MTDRLDENERLRQENAQLIRDRATNERANIASRRSLCEQRDRLAAERDALAAKLRAVEALLDVTVRDQAYYGCAPSAPGYIYIGDVRAALSADTTPEVTEPSEGAWIHVTDGTVCPEEYYPLGHRWGPKRATPSEGNLWWCTTHQSHLEWTASQPTEGSEQ